MVKFLSGFLSLWQPSLEGRLYLCGDWVYWYTIHARIDWNRAALTFLRVYKPYQFTLIRLTIKVAFKIMPCCVCIGLEHKRHANWKIKMQEYLPTWSHNALFKW
jgi:hypothetical protein